MIQDLEFFITENHPTVRKWGKEKQESGGILVGSTYELLIQVEAHTKPYDDVSCTVSGAWLDVCVENAIWKLLNNKRQPKFLSNRKISHVTVDLSTCLAFSERHDEMSVEERWVLLSDNLGELKDDPRLMILPESIQK